MLTLSHQRQVLKVPLTPLIDVVFILLLFFMLSSTFVRYHHIEFKSASSTGSKGDQESVRLILREEGKVTVDGVSFSFDLPLFAVKIGDWKSTSRKIIVTPEANVDIQTVVELLDRLRDSGINALKLSESLR